LSVSILQKLLKTSRINQMIVWSKFLLQQDLSGTLHDKKRKTLHMQTLSCVTACLLPIRVQLSSHKRHMLTDEVRCYNTHR